MYRPRLLNGNKVPMSWPIACYRLLNHICWPLQDNASRTFQLLDRLFWMLGFIIFMQHNDAELRYIIVHKDNLDKMLICGPTYLILVEIQFRAFQIGLNKESFKRFLKKFYAEIYLDKSSHPELYAEIRRSLRPIWFLSILYYTTLFSYVITLISNYRNSVRVPVFQMYYPFDISPTQIYVPIILSNLWVGFTVISMVVGEDNIISETLLHLNGRFLLLQRSLCHNAKHRIQQADYKNIADDFSNIIIESIEENVRLYEFAKKFERDFSYRIFVNLSFSAGLLCVLGFKVYTNPTGSFGFVFWMCAKLMEMLVLGELGSRLIATTNQISCAFYESNWELVLEKSKDTNANVRLMKTLLLAIGTSQKPFVLTGFNYFSVSLTAILQIIKVAVSYFTFLHNKSK
ncbi:odorant receptor 74a-like [Eurosta solidaginis]|uniref:odorant receptor 74a-like n=1 Tax=Eurosta solidaginis TaxID=178769 RepID=UPI003530565D